MNTSAESRRSSPGELAASSSRIFSTAALTIFFSALALSSCPSVAPRRCRIIFMLSSVNLSIVISVAIFRASASMRAPRSVAGAAGASAATSAMGDGGGAVQSPDSKNDGQRRRNRSRIRPSVPVRGLSTVRYASGGGLLAVAAMGELVLLGRTSQKPP